MLRAACCSVVRTIACIGYLEREGRDRLRSLRRKVSSLERRVSDGSGGGCSDELCSSVVTTIALEEDAPGPVGPGGDDDYLEEDAPRL